MKIRCLLSVLAGFLWVAVTPAEESLCASVEIEIQQGLTLERQAFDARMKINNGLVGIPLENVSVEIVITDESGTNNISIVSVNSLGDDTNALFFKQEPTVLNMDGGTIEGGTSAELNWLLIPAYGAADDNPQGTIYYVGATLTYTLQGKTEEVEVSPDYIFVKPMPYLELDYFLPGDVYGNDPSTTNVVEPSIPFPVGLRIFNSGAGAVGDVRIDSGQPEIVTNELGLLVDFAIHGSSVHGAPHTPSLLMDFGDFESLESKMGYWQMTSSLSGKFTNFSATISHSDELGGVVTSLINPTNVRPHIHIKDVVVDLPDRDRVVDFLTPEGVFESEDGLNSGVTICSNAHLDDTTDTLVFSFNESDASNRLVYGRVDNNSRGETVSLSEVIRSDGKRMLESNAWLSKERPNGTDWKHYFNVFDVDGADYTYTVVFEASGNENRAPVIHYVGPQVAYVDQPHTFMVVASDPDGALPQLSLDSRLSGATFVVSTNYADLAVGTFSWLPDDGKVGNYTIKFTASDAHDSTIANVPYSVVTGSAAETGYPGWWLSSGMINTNAEANDFAAVNKGQLKHAATMAWDQFNLLPVGAPALNFDEDGDNFAPVNLGQVKEASYSFYDQMGRAYPWASSSNAANDHAMANIGQVKAAFNFDPHLDRDGDGMPDWWEARYSSSATAMKPHEDIENGGAGDGRSNLYEYLHNSDPTLNDE